MTRDLFEPSEPFPTTAPSLGPVPEVPAVFRAQDEQLVSATALHRVYSQQRSPTEFNPGDGAPTRFGFFGDPIVPVLYAAYSHRAALAESVLDEVPSTGGELYPEDYQDKCITEISPTRELRLAAFYGLGLGAMNIRPETITHAPPSEYGNTVKWAEAAHDAGFDGIAWTSPRYSRDRVVVLFGDRVSSDDFAVADKRTIFLGFGLGLDRLIDQCTREHIEVVV